MLPSLVSAPSAKKLFVRLVYGDVKADLEAGIRPVHVHVPKMNTKGKYGSCDAFFDSEAIHFMLLIFLLQEPFKANSQPSS